MTHAIEKAWWYTAYSRLSAAELAYGLSPKGERLLDYLLERSRRWHRDN